MKADYKPEILALEKIEIDDTYCKDTIRYSGRSTWFYVVPTELVINGDRDLWKGCPPLVNFDMLECIEEVIARGDYPYNSTIGQVFCDKHGLGKFNEDTFLSAMVYCTQSYRSSIQDEIKAKNFHDAMTEQGFIRATESLLKEVVETKRKFYVSLNTTNIFGTSGKKTSEQKLLLKDWGEKSGGLHWMNPRAKRSGYRADIGQYIKEAI